MLFSMNITFQCGTKWLLISNEITGNLKWIKIAVECDLESDYPGNKFCFFPFGLSFGFSDSCDVLDSRE